MEKQYYTIAELDKIGPLSRSSWFNAIRDGLIVARKAGRRTIVMREDYDRFLKSRPAIRPRAPSH